MKKIFKSKSLRDKIFEILKSFEKGTINVGLLKTTTHNFDYREDRLEDYLEYVKEEERNRFLKYITDLVDEDRGHYEVISYVSTPNIYFLKDKLCDERTHEGLLRAELKRMESDRLILIGEQKAQQFVIDSRGDFSRYTRGDGWFIDTDSIVLTTKGKSKLRYFLYQIQEQSLAAIAIVISIASLIISVYFNLL